MLSSDVNICIKRAETTAAWSADAPHSNTAISLSLSDAGEVAGTKLCPDFADP